MFGLVRVCACGVQLSYCTSNHFLGGSDGVLVVCSKRRLHGSALRRLPEPVLQPQPQHKPLLQPRLKCPQHRTVTLSVALVSSHWAVLPAVQKIQVNVDAPTMTTAATTVQKVAESSARASSQPWQLAPWQLWRPQSWRLYSAARVRSTEGKDKDRPFIWYVHLTLTQPSAAASTPVALCAATT